MKCHTNLKDLQSYGQTPGDKDIADVVIPPITHCDIDISPHCLLLMTTLHLHEQARSKQQIYQSSALLPPKTSNKKITLVLDLDETLVHCGFEYLPDADICLDIDYFGQSYTVYGKRRPYLKRFLKEAAEYFELVCFTASQRTYAERIIKLIDPEGKISHCLFRDACTNICGNYLKDLSIIG